MNVFARLVSILDSLGVNFLQYLQVGDMQGHSQTADSQQQALHRLL